MIARLFENNLNWATARRHADLGSPAPAASGAPPRLLWIGCADSRIPPHDLVGLGPSELWVHANVGNLATNADLNLTATLQMAIETLKVRHIVVCGHYGCAGVAAALGRRPPGVLDHWLQPIRDVCDDHRQALSLIRDVQTRVNHVAELNVRAQVAGLARNPLVRGAWARRRSLTLHGWILSARDGLLRDLETTVQSLRDAQRLFTPPPPRRGATP